MSLDPNLKPKVIVNGGFSNNGAIVEGDQGIEHERTGYDTICFELYFNRHNIVFSKRHNIVFSKEAAYDDAEEIDELTGEDRKLARLSGDNDDLKFDVRLKKYAVRSEI